MQPSLREQARSHWRVTLPLVMCVVSALLISRTKPLPFNSGAASPERIINSLINGPGFYLTGTVPLPIHQSLNARFGYEGNRLLGIGGFWFLIGLSIDRRKVGLRVERHHPVVAGVLFTFGLLVCGSFGLGLTIVHLLNRTALQLIFDHPLETTYTMELGFVLWMVVLSGYFARRAFITVRHSLVER